MTFIIYFQTHSLIYKQLSKWVLGFRSTLAEQARTASFGTDGSVL